MHVIVPRDGPESEGGMREPISGGGKPEHTINARGKKKEGGVSLGSKLQTVLAVFQCESKIDGASR